MTLDPPFSLFLNLRNLLKKKSRGKMNTINEIGAIEAVQQGMQTFGIKVLLIDDQAIIAEAVHRMLEGESDIEFHYCSDPTQALQIANQLHPTVILQDLVMPEIDGLLLVKYFRANPMTREIPLIVLSTKEEPKIKADAFALGANDYLVKLPDKVELIARIRYHSSAYIRLLERNEAYEKLAEKQKILDQELLEAVGYVKSLLPLPIEDTSSHVTARWNFIPSTQLGGDAFGYHWLDSDHFAMYLLDVCGHGVGAALLSISVMNVLRSQTLPKTDFHDPVQVLSNLNEAFPMEKHNNMFLTMWYGVYNRLTRNIVYSSAGHPPAVLLNVNESHHWTKQELKTSGLVIGAMPDSEYTFEVAKVSKQGKIYIFSDGVYEIHKSDGSMLQLDEFVNEITRLSSEYPSGQLKHILQFAEKMNGQGAFADDYSIVEFCFN
jgi:phosphoserine phosphatase RsbU/P